MFEAVFKSFRVRYAAVWGNVKAEVAEHGSHIGLEEGVQGL